MPKRLTKDELLGRVCPWCRAPVDFHAPLGLFFDRGTMVWHACPGKRDGRILSGEA